MISPTGKGIRVDRWGNGHYGAPRGNSIHRGVDYICHPGQFAIAPKNGIIVREARPYGDSQKYSGLLLRADALEIKLFYVRPYDYLIGKPVKQGAVVGTCQDISKRYDEKMIPHVHMEIVSVDPEVFVRML